MVKNLNVPFHWRRFKERYQLIGCYCEKCKTYIYPIREICPKCRRAGNIKEYVFKGTGKVLTYTVIRVAPEEFKTFVPYIMAIIELDEGARVVSQIVDCKPEDIKIGMRVRAIFRKIREEGEEGLILYGFKFIPDG